MEIAIARGNLKEEMCFMTTVYGLMLPSTGRYVTRVWVS